MGDNLQGGERETKDRKDYRKEGEQESPGPEGTSSLVDVAHTRLQPQESGLLPRWSLKATSACGSGLGQKTRATSQENNPLRFVEKD